jgi:hypothetical protein
MQTDKDVLTDMLTRSGIDFDASPSSITIQKEIGFVAGSVGFETRISFHEDGSLKAISSSAF